MRRRLFLTPPNLPLTRQQRCINIPVSKEWLGIFNAALLALTQEWNYEQTFDSELTPAQCAAICYQIYEDYLKNECGEDTIVDVRQSPENSCILEKSYDGIEWIPFADLSLCAPQYRINPATRGLETSLDGETWESVPEAPWVESASPYVPEPNIQPGTTQVKRCLAAANAVEVIDAFYRETFGAVAAGLNNNMLTLNNALADINYGLLSLLYAPEQGLLETLGFFEFDFGTYMAAPGLEPEDKTALMCLLYQNATVDADIVRFDHGAIQDNVVTDVGVNPGTAIALLLGYMAPEGLDRAGGVQVVTEMDCSDCIVCGGEISWVFHSNSEFADCFSGVPLTAGGGQWYQFDSPNVMVLTLANCDPAYTIPEGYTIKTVTMNIASAGAFSTVRLNVGGVNYDIGTADTTQTWNLSGQSNSGGVLSFSFTAGGSYAVSGIAVVLECL